MANTTVADLAARFNLRFVDNGGKHEYIGANPFDPSGATDDGFALFGNGKFLGTAYDRKLDKRYTSKQVAELAGIEYDDYEASETDPSRRGANVVTYPAKSEKTFDVRDLRERGLNDKARAKFRVETRNGNKQPSSWGPFWTWPTVYADGKPGRWRRKWRYPERQLVATPGRKPAKTTWDNTTKELGQPICYNLNNVIDQADVWLVNSELAVWLFWQEGISAICPLGEGRNAESYLQIMRELKAIGCERIRVLLDNDKPGLKSATKAYEGAIGAGLQHTVYSLAGAPKLGYDASDLYEWWQSLPLGPGERRQPFREVIESQEVASVELIEAWRAGFATLELQEQERIQQEAASKVEKHLDKAGRAIKDGPQKCPVCQKKAVEFSDVSDKWICYERNGGCKASFPADKFEHYTGKGKGATKDSLANELLDMVRGHQLFKTSDGVGFIVVEQDGKRVTYRIAGPEFAQWVTYLYLRDKERVAAPDSVSAMIKALNALAVHEGAELTAYVRSAAFAGKIYVDLANNDGEVVEIDETGWRIVTQPPVFFRRALGELPLPNPVRSDDVVGLWNDFREILNVGDDRNWALLVAWLCFALVPPGEDADCPILSVHGQQGSAKSMLCRIARQTIDPNRGYGVSFVKDERDVVMAAENCRVFYLDNQTTMPIWLSNLLAAMVTGIPYRCRQLFTDDGSERFFTGQPALVINGIPEKIGGIDFNDRALKINVPILQGYKSKRDIMKEWRRLWPGLLAAIFDAMSCALRNRDEVTASYVGFEMPRLADFMIWTLSCEEVLPITNFYDTYIGNIIESAQLDTEDLLGAAVLHLMGGRDKVYENSATQAFHDLFRAAVDTFMDHEQFNTYNLQQKYDLAAGIKRDAETLVKANKTFPSSPNRLGTLMRNVAPSLRKLGIHCDFKRTNKESVWKIQRRDIISGPHRENAGVFENEIEPAGVLAAAVAGNEWPEGSDPFADE